MVPFAITEVNICNPEEVLPKAGIYLKIRLANLAEAGCGSTTVTAQQEQG